MKVFNRPIKLGGHSRTIDSKTVRVLEYDNDGNILRATGTTAPTGAGYAKGCLFIKTDAATGTKGLYENQGTTAAASFNVIGDVTGAEIADGSIVVAKLANDAVETAKIKNANVTLAKLAAAIAPSHVVKFVKLGSEITSTTLTGLLVGDLVLRFIVASSTVTAKLCAVADTLPDDPADGDYLVVLRAVA